MTKRNCTFKPEDVVLAESASHFENNHSCVRMLAFGGRIRHVNTSRKVALEPGHVDRVDGNRSPDLWLSSADPKVESTLEEGRRSRRSQFTPVGQPLKGTPRWGMWR